MIRQPSLMLAGSVTWLAGPGYFWVMGHDQQQSTRLEMNQPSTPVAIFCRHWILTHASALLSVCLSFR